MNKMTAGGGFLLGIFLGILFDEVALGIIFGLFLGAFAGKAKSRQDGGDA